MPGFRRPLEAADAASEATSIGCFAQSRRLLELSELKARRQQIRERRLYQLVTGSSRFVVRERADELRIAVSIDEGQATRGFVQRVEAADWAGLGWGALSSLSARQKRMLCKYMTKGLQLTSVGASSVALEGPLQRGQLPFALRVGSASEGLNGIYKQRGDTSFAQSSGEHRIESSRTTAAPVTVFPIPPMPQNPTRDIDMSDARVDRTSRVSVSICSVA